MDKSVIIKSNKNGINLILDALVPFDELLHKISQKFSEAKRFFGKCEMVLSVSGRNISAEETKKIVNIIHNETEISIIYIAEDSELNNEMYLNALDKLNDLLDDNACEIVRGSIISGKSVSYKHSVVIIGDVEEHAEVHTNGSIFVLGTLAGSAYAGELGNSKAKVFAADMCPDNVMIYDSLLKMPKLVESKETKSLFSKKTEEIAVKKSMLVFMSKDGITYKILN